MMLPGVVTMIPSFMIWARLKQVDTFVPLTVGAWFAWGPAYIFMMRQFFLTIPREMEEAAVIDGANIVQIYWHIMLPLIRPALLAIGVLAFQGNWNNFQSPLIYLHSTDHFPLILGLEVLRAVVVEGGADVELYDGHLRADGPAHSGPLLCRGSGTLSKVLTSAPPRDNWTSAGFAAPGHRRRVAAPVPVGGVWPARRTLCGHQTYPGPSPLTGPRSHSTC